YRRSTLSRVLSPGPARNLGSMLASGSAAILRRRLLVLRARCLPSLPHHHPEPLPMLSKADPHDQHSKTVLQARTVVVIGNGMVGHRFCQRLVEFDPERTFQVVTFCEEPRPAYDRVNLTKYFEHRRAEKLALSDPKWYEQRGITLFVG